LNTRLLLVFALLLNPAQDAGVGMLLRAENQLMRESYRSAVSAAGEALALSERTADRSLKARALRLSGNALNGLGEVEQAAAQHRRALELARSLGDRDLEARVLVDVGLGHFQHAAYGEAEQSLRGALALQHEMGDPIGEATTRVALGRIPFKEGRYDEALAMFQGALAMQEQIGDRGGQASTLLAIALLRTDLRSFKLALADAARALALQEAIGDPVGRIEVRCKMASMYLFQDAPGEALEHLGAALALADSENDPSLRAKVLHHIAGAHQEAGRHHEAIEAYDQALRAMENEGNLREAAWVLVRRGRSFETLDRLAEAEASYVRALAIWERIRERRPRSYYLYALGRLQERRGDEHGALGSYRRALEAQEAVRLPYSSLVLTNMALLVQRQGDAVEALELAQRAVKAAGESGNPEMRWSAYHGLGRLLHRMGRNQQALPALNTCLTIIEAMRNEVAPSDEARAGFMESKQDAYADTVTVLFDLGLFGDALETAERARARAFLDLLSRREISDRAEETRGGVPLQRGAAGPAGSGHPGPAPVAPARLGDLRREAARLGTTLVAYFVSESDLFTWVASPGGRIRSVRSPMRRAELEERVRRLEAALERGPFIAPRTGSPPGDVDTLLRGLHRDLLEPVDRWLPADPRALVTIIPHGPLFRISFGALLDPRGRYVAETHTLHYTPAVNVLHFTEERVSRARNRRDPRLLAVGGPSMRRGGEGTSALAELPGSAEEARRIAASWPAGRSTLLTGDAARESRLRDLAPRHAVVHLASHAIVLDKAPLESFVALAQGAGRGPEDDGALTVSEVFDLDLSADLVTLSACDTGRGRITGDGVLGLSRAFLCAGASSVVVSLWRVADVVGQFQMERFYQALAAGDDKARALDRAQLDTLAALRQGELHTPDGRILLPTPALWAPFVLVGEPR
jgi:CHAT domain-containing protein/tetratricopeptide (TPR) repeat protein